VTGTSTSGACGPLTATDQGVTAKQITIGVVVVDMGSASSLINLPSAADVQKAYTAVFDDINAKGGVRCRKIVPKFYTDSVLQTSQEHAACLQMQQDKVFTVFNNLFNTTEQTCIAKAHIPNIWYTTPHTPDVHTYAPYIMSWQPDYDHLIRRYVRGAQSLGWFTGMTKLGILEQTCYPDENTAITNELRGIGVNPDQASIFNYGCPAAAPTPDQDQQAVLQFKAAGVTHVLNVAYADDAGFSIAADQQSYKPKFAHMEDASATAIESGTQKPGNSFDGTLLITTIETGARNTPGYRYNAATQDCARILTRAGLSAPYATDAAKFFGIACVNVELFKQAAERAPALLRSQLASGFAKLGSLQLSYPAGPVDITNASLPVGGQLWRPGVWSSACECWKVTDARYRAGD
jgi:ABC-type branched-subunit amino acid transport system substrate-binding protein